MGNTIKNYSKNLRIINRSKDAETKHNLREAKEFYKIYTSLFEKVKAYYVGVGAELIESLGEKNCDELDDFTKLESSNNKKYACSYNMEMDYWIIGKVKNISASIEVKLDEKDIQDMIDNGFEFKDTSFYGLAKLITKEDIDCSLFNEEITKFYREVFLKKDTRYGISWSTKIKGVYSVHNCVYDRNKIKYTFTLNSINLM